MIDRNYLRLFLHELNKNCDQSLIIESSDTQSQLCSLWWRVSEYIPKIKSIVDEQIKLLEKQAA
jgi:hypothetical protein